VNIFIIVIIVIIVIIIVIIVIITATTLTTVTHTPPHLARLIPQVVELQYQLVLSRVTQGSHKLHVMRHTSCITSVH